MNSPITHEQRLSLARKSLKGISIGDAFGDSFFGKEEEIIMVIQQHKIPSTQWEFTDDTVMAIALYQSLERYRVINQDFVAQQFKENYFKDINRGYGPSMHSFFREIKEGKHWRDISYSKFEGMGSMGNGGAMRAGVIGAYFFDDLEEVKTQTKLSCEITHTNIEAIEGAKAIAIATALATQKRFLSINFTEQAFLQQIYDELEDSDLKSKVNKAISLEGDYSIETLVYALGNGIKMTAQDTVPLALWCASRYLTDFEKGLWKTVSALGDRDTICAMVGGILIMSVDESTIPTTWLDSVEKWEKSIFNF
ncbi:ADP-ribosylglycohydrolase family protein [Emticicia fontis]